MLTAPQGSSLGLLAEQAWERFGGSSTLLFEGTTLTAAELGARARRFAGGLVESGVQPGDRVAVCMANCPEVLETYHAVWRLARRRHAAAVPAQRRRAAPRASSIPARCRGHDAGDRAEGQGGDHRPGRALRRRGDAHRRDAVASTTSQRVTRRHWQTSTRPDMAALLYTGGTTGRSKGVMLTHDAHVVGGLVGHPRRRRRRPHRQPAAAALGARLRAAGRDDGDARRPARPHGADALVRARGMAAARPGPARAGGSRGSRRCCACSSTSR